MQRSEWEMHRTDISDLEVDLKHLYYFVITAETGNITKAAKRLYITQPVLSKNIMALEDQVGFPLLQRKERTISLTRHGEYFYEKWSSLVHTYLKDLEGGRRLSRSPLEALRVGCFPVQNFHRFLRPFTDRIAERYPDITLEMQRMNYISLLDQLNNARADVIFMFLDDLPENRDCYEWRIIAVMPLVAAVPPDDPLARRDIVRIEELRESTLLLTEPVGSLSRMDAYEKMLEQHGLNGENVRYVNNYLTAYSEAERGHGIALGIRAIFPEEDRVKLIDVEGAAFPVVMVWNRNAPEATKDLLRELWE